MKYIINNVKCIDDKNLQRRAKQIVKKQTDRLSRIVDNYRKPVTVNIFFNQIDNITYQISAVVVLRENIIFLKERDKDIEAGIFRLFDKLKLSITRKIRKEKKDYLFRRKKTRIKNIHENLQNLQDLRQETTRETFKKFSKILLHDVSNYVKRRMKTMEMTTELKRDKSKVQELLDELFLIIYDNFEKIPQDKEKLTVWLYKQADELLDKNLKEYKFNNEKIVRLENILEKEWKSFNEQFTIDAEEEIIPLEELDGFPPEKDAHSIYDLIFDENEDSLIDEITLKMDQDKIQKIIHLELAKLPHFERSIMDMYLIDQLSEEEIAAIKNITVEEINTIIKNSINKLKNTLKFDW